MSYIIRRCGRIPRHWRVILCFARGFKLSTEQISIPVITGGISITTIIYWIISGRSDTRNFTINGIKYGMAMISRHHCRVEFCIGGWRSSVWMTEIKDYIIQSSNVGHACCIASFLEISSISQNTHGWKNSNNSHYNHEFYYSKTILSFTEEKSEGMQ